MFEILTRSTSFPLIVRSEIGRFKISLTTKYTKTLSPTLDQVESWFEENIFTEIISGGPTSILTKLSSDVVLSVRPMFPGQSIKSISNDTNPPTAVSGLSII